MILQDSTTKQAGNEIEKSTHIHSAPYLRHPQRFHDGSGIGPQHATANITEPEGILAFGPAVGVELNMLFPVRPLDILLERMHTLQEHYFSSKTSHLERKGWRGHAPSTRSACSTNTHTLRLHIALCLWRA